MFTLILVISRIIIALMVPSPLHLRGRRPHILLVPIILLLSSPIARRRLDKLLLLLWGLVVLLGRRWALLVEEL